MTLTEFLLARIGDDEEVARAAGDCERVGSTIWTVLSTQANGAKFGPRGSVEATPARVLAECAAKRRVLDLHRSGEAWCDHCSGWYGPDPAADCPTLRALALPYADHPDYRDEWKP